MGHDASLLENGAEHLFCTTTSIIPAQRTAGKSHVPEGSGDYRFRVGYEYIMGNRLFRSTGYDNPHEAGFTHGDDSVLNPDYS